MEAGGADAGEDAVDFGAYAVHCGEDVLVEGVEADGDAVQSGQGERFGMMCEEDSVGGDGEIIHAIDGGKEADQIIDSPAQKRFSTGQADLSDSQRGKGLDELLLVNCFLRPGFLEAEGPGKVGVQEPSAKANS